MPRESYEDTIRWIRTLPKYRPGTRPECASLPASVSWEAYTGLDRSQGRCGSCYIFGPVGVLEIQRSIDCCDLDIVSEMARCDCEPSVPLAECGCPYAPGDARKLDLSEQIVLECSRDGFLNGCFGGSSRMVVEFLADAGTIYEAIEPYEFTLPEPWYVEPFPNICALLDRGDDLSTPVVEPYNGVCDLEDRVLAAPGSYPPLDFFRVVRVPPDEGGPPSAAFSIADLTPTRPTPGSDGYLPLLRTLCEGYVVALLVPYHVVVVVGYEGYNGTATEDVGLIIQDSARASTLVRDGFRDPARTYWNSVRSDRVFLIRQTTIDRGCPTGWLTDDPAINDADTDGILNMDDVCLYIPNPSAIGTDGVRRAAGPDLDGDYWPEDGPGISDLGCDYCPGITEGERWDFDGDLISSVCDSCPRHGVDPTGVGVYGAVLCPGCRDARRWGVPDGERIDSECPADPDEDGRCNGVVGEVDDGGRMRILRCDNCEEVWNFNQADRDLGADGVGDVCDNCPRAWNPDQTNSDADAYGDVCDLCPWFHEEWAGQDNLLEGRGTLARDLDGDDVGNRCDNCDDEPNKDQANCNEQDERDWFSGDPAAFVGTGDACDSYPCVDLCTERAGLGNAVRVPFACGVSPFNGEWACSNEEPLTAHFCAVGANDAATDPPGPGYKPGMPFPTNVQGCWCSPTERSDGVCQAAHRCPAEGRGGGRWEPIDYPDPLGCAAPECVDPSPSYTYQALYTGDPYLGLAGERFSPAGNYAVYYGSAVRRRQQEWNWKTQFGADPKSLQMWFKPEAAAWFPGYGLDYGNTYTSWTEVGGIPAAAPAPGAWPPGQTLFPTPKAIILGQPIEWPRQPLADLIWEYVCRVAIDCPWSPWFFFDERGPRVGGIVVRVWDAARDVAGAAWGTKLAPGEMFDVVSPSVAFAFDQAGDPSRYWLFGGLDAAGRPTDEMWGARRAIVKQYGSKTYTDFESPGDGAIVPGLPDGAQNVFDLSRIPSAGPWPEARVGATLVCSGVGVVAGRACDKLCPKVDVAYASSTTSGFVGDDAGALTLVGGLGLDGPRDDIWMYDQAIQRVEPGTTPGDGAIGGRSGWRRVAFLPGAEGGLSDAGSIQIDRTLWLVAGRTAFWATSDVWTVSLESGAATKVETAGGKPPPRVRPALAYDSGRNRLLMFGGAAGDGTPGFTDLWQLDLYTFVWTRLAAPCTGAGCPVVTGGETLVYDGVAREATVIADRSGPGAADGSWTLREGIWWTERERLAPDAPPDCDGDGAVEEMWGARCGSATAGFPDFGRLLCVAGELACRVPAAPGEVLWEYSVPMLKAAAGVDSEVLMLKGNAVDAYALAADGTLERGRTIALRRAAHDIAATSQLLLAADGRGLSIYRLGDGALVTTFETCGKARRVFVDGSWAFVVGVRSVLVADVGDAAAPRVVARYALQPGPAGLVSTKECGCSWLRRGVDDLCDLTGACGAFGRDVAAYDRGRLFLNMLGSVYVLDFTAGELPAVSSGAGTGLLGDMRVEGRFLYANAPWGDGVVLAADDAGEWTQIGGHDVARWVEGALAVGDFAIWWAPGRLQIATRQ
ncbi:MAG: hypothetical protein QME96_03195 [Myxococcota bacterium]|nr:hypothetical protein [Myxococcota bacterium]